MRFVNAKLQREGGLETEEGFPLIHDPYTSVLVGGRNRDRNFVRVPIGVKYAPVLKDKSAVVAGSFYRTGKGTLLIIEEQNPGEKRIGILLHAIPGFRGMSVIESQNPGTTFMERGQIWDSEVGSKGVGDIVMAIACPGDRLRVTRSGRLYGSAEEMFVIVNDDMSLSAMEADDLKKKEEAEGDQAGTTL